MPMLKMNQPNKAYMMQLLTRCAPLMIAGILAGCSGEQSLQYTHVSTTPPLKYPADVTPPVITELMPIPPLANTVVTPAVVTNKKGNGFQMPRPAPIEIQNNQVATLIGKPAAPIYSLDGNGYPLLQIDGDSNLVWERLNAALVAANVTVVDRNQSVGKINVTYKNVAVELNASTSRYTTTVAVQEGLDKLTDEKLAKSLLSLLVKHWPAN